MAWPKGRKHTEESKRKMGDVNKGKKLSEETKKKIAKAHRGKKLSGQIRRKMSESHKGKELSEQTRRKVSEALKGKKFSEEHKNNLSKAHADVRGSKNPSWKGGRRIQNGRSFLLMPEHPGADQNGYVLEYRWIMEKHLGRFLEAEEVVHHINGDSMDNRIENLMLLKNTGEHSRLHQAQNRSFLKGSDLNETASTQS